jgi:hypothetical protein
MAGIAVASRLRETDFVLVPGAEHRVAPLLTADRAPMFVRDDQRGVPTFICSSAEMIDIDVPVTGRSFDVKDYFCSIVPLTLFVTSVFRDVIWRPQQGGACLILDDPLLKPTYGFCDFKRLLALMNRHDFTTNIAFIPWNWRRTSAEAARFFGAEPHRFSISIHGCDHTASEFGETETEPLHAKASLARSRMQNHAARTGIAHDPIMVFPQGVFSSQAPGVLKRNGFLAAVNTEVNPIDGDRGPLVRDVWDVAITRYSAFPIFTRRSPFDGLENFAFDLLIGKPCLIVTHHQFFRNECADLIEFIGQLSSLKTRLAWNSLGQVIRQACRRRTLNGATEEAQMYSPELVITNHGRHPIELLVHKREDDPSCVASVSGNRRDLEWAMSGGHLVFTANILPGHEGRFSVRYRHPDATLKYRRPIRLEASVAARRLLCEVRDEYWQTLVPSKARRSARQVTA